MVPEFLNGSDFLWFLIFMVSESFNGVPELFQSGAYNFSRGF